ncbi:MAG: family 16 glycosylhydrolase [Pseudonocardia sp.]|uniref:family 16 glycosylhydrolase n=1 Tax=Pseudonocardia sp. TaxID=60912 RepID=UPI001AD3CE8E|nr:family 16 glycosylhydrolase [Pseudonocardia sp.]MBN9102114.1 family 16 glycosylhydrolase [Pseudonocardia sp.]
MSRHSLPSSGLPDRGTSRHGLADTVADGSPAADAPGSGRPAIPRPRTPSESRHAPSDSRHAPSDSRHAPSESRHAVGTARHAADGLGAGPAPSRHAADAPPAARSDRPAGRHATADESETQRPIHDPSTGRPAEPLTAPLPVVRAQSAPEPVADETPTAATDDDDDDPAGDPAPTRTAGRHAAPTRHRRRTDADASRPDKGRRALAGLGGSRRTAAVLLTAAVALVTLPTAGSAAVDQCRWQVAAHDLLVSLDGQTDTRSVQLRKALTRAGVGAELPAECAGQAADDAASPAPATSAPRTRTPRTTAPKPAPAATTPPKATAAPKTTTAAPAPAPAAAGTGTGSTAAQALGWGTPTKSDDFSAGLGQWGVYDGSGHAGNGRRTPSAITTADGIMTMTGDTNGNTGGMAWGDGQKYGRWEARVRSTAGSYHPVMLLWPSAENWPIGGEVDWMEISDPARKVADTFLHYGANNNQVQGDVNVDATQWHNWAVEWTPQGITTYLDGKAWWSTKNTSILPPGPMHMTIQLDNFGGRNTTTQMQVDWVRQYAL